LFLLCYLIRPLVRSTILYLCLYILFANVPLQVLPTAPLTHSLAKFIPGHLPDNSKVFASLHGLQPRHPSLLYNEGLCSIQPCHCSGPALCCLCPSISNGLQTEIFACKTNFILDYIVGLKGIIWNEPTYCPVFLMLQSAVGR